MRGRYPAAPGLSSLSFGPGPLSPAIKIIIGINVAAFLVDAFSGGALTGPLRGSAMRFALRPEEVFGLQIWQPLTYMFLHGGIFHLLFNMLALWMFGTELERMWGTRFFTKFYLVSGIGAAATTIILSFMPGTFGTQLYLSLTVGASGAVYGILLAYAVYFPHRPIYFWFLFPIPAKYFVMIIGGIALFSSMQAGGGGIAHTTHLGGLVAAYVYLKGTRMHLLSEIQYRYLKWRINRMRRRFDVHPGGRNDVNRRVH
jgi:membrane associated rhomboid family serine protease